MTTHTPEPQGAHAAVRETLKTCADLLEEYLGNEDPEPGDAWRIEADKAVNDARAALDAASVQEPPHEAQLLRDIHTIARRVLNGGGPKDAWAHVLRLSTVRGVTDGSVLRAEPSAQEPQGWQPTCPTCGRANERKWDGVIRLACGHRYERLSPGDDDLGWCATHKAWFVTGNYHPDGTIAKVQP